jgi:hypothetical protein
MSNAELAGRLGLVVFVFAAVLLLTCRKWDNPLDPTGNHPPWEPSNPRPSDFGFGTSIGLVLSWESHDPDEGDQACFAVAFGTDSALSVFKENGFDTTFRPTGVVCSTRYYWRVKAYDEFDTVVGPVWQFLTVPALAVTAPDTGEQMRMYSQDTVTWTGGPPGVGDSTLLYLSVDDGASWTRLGKAASPGRFVWEVPAPATESARVKVKVFALSDTMTGKSGRFTVVDTATIGNSELRSSSLGPQTSGGTGQISRVGQEPDTR